MNIIKLIIFAISIAHVVIAQQLLEEKKELVPRSKCVHLSNDHHNDLKRWRRPSRKSRRRRPRPKRKMKKVNKKPKPKPLPKKVNTSSKKWEDRMDKVRDVLEDAQDVASEIRPAEEPEPTTTEPE